MHLTPDDWAQLSRLLDEVLDLPEAEWAAWLERQQGLSDTLRAALHQRLAEEAAGLGGNSLPPLPQYTDTGSPAIAATTLQPGAAVGPYRIVRELGRGGMGSVWLAERSDGVLKRPVALKLPHTGLASTQLAERLARERDILASLTHPHIARLYDAGISEQGQPYLALEYIEGQSLLDYCTAQGLGLAARLQLFLQVLDAVQHAHGQLVVHRDLKPSNILVTASGEVRLLDFGVAKLLQDTEGRELTETHHAPMTPQYAAPEQILGQPVGIAADIYALGVLLFELLSCARPYKLARDTRGALEQAILDAEPAPPSQAARGQVAWVQALRGDLDTITLKALKKAPDQRYATAAAFADDLRRHLAGEPVLARPDTFAYRSGKFVKRHRWAVAAGSSAVLALVVALGVAVWQARVAREQTAVAQRETGKAQKETAAAQAINDFMQGVFFANSAQQDNPTQARNRTARELLDIAASKIDSSLKDAPEARLTLMRSFTEIYNQLELYDQSLAMVERTVQQTRLLYGSSSPELVEALQMMSSARRSRNVDDPGQFTALVEAGSVLKDLPQAPSEWLMDQQAQSSEFLADHDPVKAHALMAAAVRLAEARLQSQGFGDESVVLYMAAWQALQWGECAKAKEIAGRSETRARANIAANPVGGDYMTLVKALYLGGRASRCLGDLPVAQTQLRQASEAAARTMGKTDLRAVRADAYLAETLLAQDQVAEAERLRLSVVARMAGHSALEKSPLHFDALAAAARLHLTAQQLAKALDFAQRALALRDPAIDASPYVAEVLRIEAAALAGLGRKAEAQVTLARAVAMRQKALVTTGPALAEEAAIAATLAAR